MKNYKIVFVDIDDTLNPSNGEVSQYTKEVMKKIKDKGIKIIINTGRSSKYAVEKSIEAGLSNIVVSSNGTEIYDYENNVVIFNNKIPENKVREIYDYCSKFDLTLILNTIGKRFINKKDYNYNSEPVEYFDNLDEVLKSNEVNQLIILSSNFDRMLVMPNLFKEKYPDLKFVHSSIALTEGTRIKNKEYYHDLVFGNISKGTGIVELLDYYGIDSSEAIAIGNGYDDITMMDVVETGIAVDNANDQLKQVADIVCESSANDGVAKILNKLILEEN